MRNIFLFSLLCLLMLQCSEPSFTPKPRAYPRVIYPEKSYQLFDENYCQFTFEYPAYARIQQDTSFFDEEPAHPCWFNLYFPTFDSQLHCSYYEIGRIKTFERLKLDAFEMADWHNKRANYIDEVRIEKPNDEVYGFAFEIQGPAASSFQFYLTDSTDHFLRGSLYFNTRTQPDSLAPVISFIKTDLLRMIETFKWTDQ